MAVAGFHLTGQSLSLPLGDAGRRHGILFQTVGTMAQKKKEKERKPSDQMFPKGALRVMCTFLSSIPAECHGPGCHEVLGSVALCFGQEGGSGLLSPPPGPPLHCPPVLTGPGSAPGLRGTHQVSAKGYLGTQGPHSCITETSC